MTSDSQICHIKIYVFLSLISQYQVFIQLFSSRINLNINYAIKNGVFYQSLLARKLRKSINFTIKMGCFSSRKESTQSKNNVSFHRDHQQGEENDNPTIIAAAAHHSLGPSKITKSRTKNNEDRQVCDQIYSLQEPAIVRVQASPQRNNLKKNNMCSTFSIVIHEERQSANPQNRERNIQKSGRLSDVLSNKTDIKNNEEELIDNDDDHLKVEKNNKQVYGPLSPLHINISHEYQDNRSNNSEKYTQINAIKFDLAIRLSPIKMENNKLYGDDLSVTSNSVHGIRGFRSIGNLDISIAPVEMDV